MKRPFVLLLLASIWISAAPASAQVISRIGIAGTLSSHGVREEHIAPLVRIASGDICHHTNPRPCTPARGPRGRLARESQK